MCGATNRFPFNCSCSVLFFSPLILFFEWKIDFWKSQLLFLAEGRWLFVFAPWEWQSTWALIVVFYFQLKHKDINGHLSEGFLRAIQHQSHLYWEIARGVSGWHHQAWVQPHGNQFCCQTLSKSEIVWHKVTCLSKASVMISFQFSFPFTHSLIRSFINSFIHSFIHSVCVIICPKTTFHTSYHNNYIFL